MSVLNIPAKYVAPFRENKNSKDSFDWIYNQITDAGDDQARVDFWSVLYLGFGFDGTNLKQGITVVNGNIVR